MKKDVMDELHDSMENQFLPMFSVASGQGVEAFPGVYSYTNQIANICFVEHRERPSDWVLIDAGMPGSVNRILEVVENRYGKRSKPQAILLTHGHFDHVGALVDLVEKWEVKVYAHERELPYLTGEKHYPKPDGTVEGGMVAKMSPIFPVEPIDLGNQVEVLPSDGTVPYLSEWKWVATPGHTPGHVSYFREADRTLIAGDAFVTVKQESLYKVMTQEMEINGPPRYLTPDWDTAWESIKKLGSLQPSMAVTGHGKPVSGKELREGLKYLVEEFDRIAIPDYGRYVDPR